MLLTLLPRPLAALREGKRREGLERRAGEGGKGRVKEVWREE